MIEVLKAAGKLLDAGVQPYSGRAMYGSTCAGIWGELTDVLAAIVRVAPDQETAVQLIEAVRWDSPVVYWPNVRCDRAQVLRRDIEEAIDAGVEDVCDALDITEDEYDEAMS